MSLIATFWTFKKEGLADLLEKIKPYEKEITKKSWFKKAKTESVYPWFDYLNENAHQEAECDFSGMAVTDFDLILMDSSSSIFDCGLSESNLISEYSGGSAVLISYEAANKIIKNMATLNLAEADVVKFYDEDEKPEDWRCNPEDVVNSGNFIKSWCGKVTPDKLGLLVIG
jgi:hypothetical protein